MAGIDDSVGALLSALDAEGILDDTIVIYTSDQGMFLGEHDYQDKRWSYEESLQAPFLVRYPREISAGVRHQPSDGQHGPGAYSAGLRRAAGARGDARCILQAFWPGDRRANGMYFRYWMHLAHRHQDPAHFGDSAPTGGN